MRCLLVFLVLAAITGVAAGQTAPADKAAATAAFADGQTAYENRNYKFAAVRFRTAYREDPNPLYLFNAAQAYRLANDCPAAYDAYVEFVKAVQGKHVAGLEQVEQYIRELKPCSTQSGPPEPLILPTESSQPAPLPVPAPTIAPSLQQPEPQPQPTGGSWLESKPLAYGLVAGGVVVVGLAVAAQVHLGHFENESAVCNGPPLSSGLPTDCTVRALNSSLNQSGKAWETITVTGYVVGGIAAVAGAALLYLDYSRPRSQERMVFAAPTPGGASVFATWRF